MEQAILEKGNGIYVTRVLLRLDGVINPDVIPSFQELFGPSYECKVYRENNIDLLEALLQTPSGEKEAKMAYEDSLSCLANAKHALEEGKITGFDLYVESHHFESEDHKPLLPPFVIDVPSSNQLRITQTILSFLGKEIEKPSEYIYEPYVD